MQRCSTALYLTCVWMAGAAAPAAFAQHKVDARHLYERMMTRVPMVGKGTFADPKRPMYAPLPSAINPASKTGIIGFTYQVSDDGKYALAEFVARDRAAFRQILADTSPEVKSFVRGVHKREDIEAEFKKYKKDFDFSQFGVRMP